jgi:hypothetical protein
MLMTVEAPDRRAQSHMNGDTRMIHARLEAWASWVKHDLASLGFPPQTLLSRCIEYGTDGAHQSGKQPVMPDDVAVTDCAVAKLGVIDQRVIRSYYLEWAPREKLAKRCSMRTRQFDAVLKRARWRISYFVMQAIDDAIKLS